MSENFIYDGTFYGLLSAVFDIYDRKAKFPILHKQDNQLALFQTITHTLTADMDKAKRVWKGIEKKAGIKTCNKIYKTFLSELPSMEMHIVGYIRYLFSSVNNAQQDFSHPDVLAIEQIARKVSREKHRMEAFVRFESIGNKTYYASIEPDYNVLPLISAHFRKRYANQNWIIYDIKRNYGVHYDTELEILQEVQMDFHHATKGNEVSDILVDENELLYQKLWKQYFKSTNIVARKNSKLHIKHVPKRYWKYLIEKIE
jgi:probable DNA metabolism protein